MKTSILSLAVFLLASVACKKTSLTPMVGQYDNRDEQTGIYRVYTDSGSYDITLEKFDSAGWYSVNSWIKISNVLELFPALYCPVALPQDPDYTYNLEVVPFWDENQDWQPVIDVNGKHWSVYTINPPDGSYSVNRIIGDTVRMYLCMSNEKYVQTDQTSLDQRKILIEAVKVGP